MTEPLTIAGRYQIQEYLGSGTYAIVYRAEDSILRRTVALKILKPFWGTEPDIKERFLREARAAANLMHPQIAWVYDIGQDRDRHYLAQRYVAGTTLDKVVAEKGALPWAEALSILEQMADALDFAHARGIIHRDLKPQNIILSEAEGAVLTDFGLTRAVDDTSRITQAGTIVGTPQYIAPEVWEGQPAGPASDQYALACIFFEILTGNVTFEGPIIETILSNGDRLGQSLGPLAADLSPQVFQALSKALTRRPEGRYPSLANLVSALKGAMSESGPALAQVSRDISEIAEEAVGKQGDWPGPQVDATATGSAFQAAKTGSLQGRLPESGSPGWRQGLRNIYQRLSSTGERRASGAYRLIPFDDHGEAPMGGESAELVVDRETIVLGRSASCDIVIHDADVSRQHAIIMRVAGRHIVKDLRSTNGTYVNGRRVMAEAQLQDEDVIALGRAVRFLFRAAPR